VALSQGSAPCSAFTLVLEGDPQSDERAEAEMIATRLGLSWSTVPVPASATTEELARAVRIMGPTAFPAFPLSLAVVDAAAASGAEVLMDGAGGEPLFSASPVVVGDLLRKGRLSDAIACAASYDREWTYDTRTILKTLARAVTPLPLLRLREALRTTAPWVRADGEVVAPRSARGHLVESLLAAGRSDTSAHLQRLASAAGIEYSAPLCDLRLVDLALRLPDDQRAPLPHPKPVYDDVLTGYSRSRVKAVQAGYFSELARNLQEAFPSYFDPCGVLASSGVVRVKLLSATAEDRWRIQSLPIVPLAAWLQRSEEE
jgi:asparagine synthetase B (glutamine-hydrolysing)